MRSQDFVSQMSMLNFFCVHYDKIKNLIINSDWEKWNSLKITYESPHVDRLWMEVDLPRSIWSIPIKNSNKLHGYNSEYVEASTKYRLMLHKIYPCDSAFYHPHPWVSVCHIIKGSYKMEFGIENKKSSLFVMSANSTYEIVDSSIYHSVYPLENQPVYSIMLIGRKHEETCSNKLIKKQMDLSEFEKKKLYNEFYGLLTCI